MALTATHRGWGGSALRRAGGFGLVEAVVSVLIVAVMLVAALTTLGGVAKGRLVQTRQSRGLCLAQQLMSEILQAWYEDPQAPGFGPEPGEGILTREGFDDVDDYLLWDASPPQAKDGTPLAGYAGWRRRVSVVPGFPGHHPAGDVVMITVTVTDPHGNETELGALRSRFTDPRQPADETTYVTWTGIELQIGGDTARRVDSGAKLVNDPIGQ